MNQLDNFDKNELHLTWDWRHDFCHKACNIMQQEIFRQALSQFLRNQSRAQIPGTLSAIA